MILSMWRGGGWMPMGFFWVIVVIGLIVLVVLALLNSGKGEGQNQDETEKSETGLDVLKKRYARGEIEDEEFEHKKKRLEE